GDLKQDLTLLGGASFILGGNENGGSYKSWLGGADFLLKWKPNRHTMIEWQSEYFYQRKESPSGTENLGGFYTYLLGQWTSRWGAGLRLDYLGLPSLSAKTYRVSPMVVFKPSEFFQVRAQYDYLKEEGSRTNHAGLLQWIFTMGPHGAHPF
ncbi:MAG: hypothetical protein KDK66_09045, partial [Deltaproteobacteria bacterium]|nr:hypothetical protein [Deltaproteobacteria bacterium]